MKPSVVTLFAGGGGSAIGARAAGFEPVGAVEYDPAIAEVYASNVSPLVTVSKVEEADPTPFVGIDALCASPVCTRASIANANRGESAVDMAAAEGVCNWLRVTPGDACPEGVSRFDGPTWDCDDDSLPNGPATPGERAWVQSVGGVFAGLSCVLLLASLLADLPDWLGLWLAGGLGMVGVMMMMWDGEGRR